MFGWLFGKQKKRPLKPRLGLEAKSNGSDEAVPPTNVLETSEPSQLNASESTFLTELPTVIRTFRTTQDNEYVTREDRVEAFEKLWRQAAREPLDNAIMLKDPVALAECFAWIDALIEDREGHYITFCFSILNLGKKLLTFAIEERSLLLRVKATYYTMRSDDFGMGDLSHSALHNEVQEILKEIRQIDLLGWR